MISIATKNRSLIKSKFRKGSLSRSDETYLSLANTTVNSASLINQPTPAGANNPPQGGSTALNYSNSTASSGTSNSRKSLISNPINFQHIRHMGPNDGKSYMVTDTVSPVNTAGSGLPPLGNTRLANFSTLNSASLTESSHHPPPKKSTSSSGMRQIAKNDISAPTNFRHVIRGLDDFGVTPTSNIVPVKPTQSPPQCAKNASSRSTDSTPAQTHGQVQQPSNKSSSLSSSSSSSSSILNSPNSPNTSANTNQASSSNNNTENLSQSISNTLKANSQLYNGELI